MNYYAAREIQKDGQHTGLFHFTCMNDGVIWPVGYCSPQESCKDCEHLGYMTVEQKACKTCNGRGLVKRANPCLGHATIEDACEHYKAYQLDRMQIDGPKVQEWPKEKCAVDGCNSEAKYVSIIPGDYHRFELCEVHANKEAVAGLFKVGECCSS